MASSERFADVGTARPEDRSTQRAARIAGVLLLITFATSIPAALLFDPVLDNPAYITGAGSETRVLLGAFLEVLLVIANIGTAVVLFPILKRQSETLALGYVTARIVECVFIAVGLGPGFVVGVGNGLMLGYLMYRSQLVPRQMAVLGRIGGPLICLSGIAVLFDLIEPRVRGAGHREHPRVLLGAVARHLPDGQGVRVARLTTSWCPSGGWKPTYQAAPSPCRGSCVTCPGTSSQAA